MKAKLRLLALPVALGLTALGISATSGANAANPAATPIAPVAKTNAATALTDHSATLNGTVTPNGSATTCYFEYGTTATYGSRTADQTITPSSTATTQTVTAKLTGLASKTAFHDTLVCTSTAGVGKGADSIFTTTDSGPSVIRLSGHTGFVSTGGISGVFIGCYGDRNCEGSLTITRGGQVIGHRSAYFVPAQSGGIVHVPLTAAAVRQLKALGSYDVVISSKTTDGQTLQGGDNGRTLTFHIFL